MAALPESAARPAHREYCGSDRRISRCRRAGPHRRAHRRRVREGHGNRIPRSPALRRGQRSSVPRRARHSLAPLPHFTAGSICTSRACTVCWHPCCSPAVSLWPQLWSAWCGEWPINALPPGQRCTRLSPGGRVACSKRRECSIRRPRSPNHCSGCSTTSSAPITTLT